MTARRLLPVAALAAAVALTACGGGGDGVGSGPRATARTSPFLGVTLNAGLLAMKVDLDRQMADMHAAGATTVRVPFYWRELEPRRGAPRLSGSDRVALAAARHELAVLPVVLGTPPWAAASPDKPNSPPAGTATFAAFMRILVGRYGPKGSLWADHPKALRLPIRDWQIWNEPNHLTYWSDQPFATGYVALLKAAHRAVKAADPGARTVLAGFPDRSWDLLGDIYRAGGKGAFDAAAVHPYTAEVGGVLKIVGLDRAAMRRAGDAGTPLWLTEVTWSSGEGKVRQPFGFETSKSGQAARLAEILPKLAGRRKMLGIQRIYWESWATGDRDVANTFDYSGLRTLRPDGTTADKPALAAFTRVAKKLSACGHKSLAGVCP